VTNLITPHALFSPVFLQSCSVIHESGSDNSFQRYGHSKFSKMTAGQILDLVQPEVGPFDPLSPKTPKMAISRHLGFGETGNTAIQSAIHENPTRTKHEVDRMTRC